jgi:hypothetical protein
MDMDAMNKPYGPDFPHISRFAALFGPPSPAAAPVPVDWDEVESWLGLRLPADYKAVVSAYGPLDIGEFIGSIARVPEDPQVGRFVVPTGPGTGRATVGVSRDTLPGQGR